MFMYVCTHIHAYVAIIKKKDHQFEEEMEQGMKGAKGLERESDVILF